MRVFLILIIVITSGCGFKIVNHTNNQNFYISEINFSGDNKINFDLKNKIIFNNSDLDKTKISLDIKTSKRKSIKEKNSKNEITKYLIAVDLLVNIKDENNNTKTLSLSDQLDYNVNIQNSQTIIAEKDAVKTITNNLAEKLLREISLLYLNDL